MAENACAKLSVLVTTHSVTAMNAQAPTGRGSRIKPRMVEEKMDKRHQPWTVAAEGVQVSRAAVTCCTWLVPRGTYAPALLRPQEWAPGSEWPSQKRLPGALA